VRPAGPPHDARRDAAHEQIRQAALVSGVQRVGYPLQEDLFLVIWRFMGGALRSP
jgi:hypothetical protein